MRSTLQLFLSGWCLLALTPPAVVLGKCTGPPAPRSVGDSGSVASGMAPHLPDTTALELCLPDCDLPAEVDWTRDVLSTALELDLASLEGVARIVLAPSSSLAASFSVGDLSIHDVRYQGRSLRFAVDGDRLDVGVPASLASIELVISYAFVRHDELGGFLDTGSTYLWPYHCGNLYPCKPDPEDGMSFTLEVRNPPAGQVAVYPRTIAADAPSYMLAFAAGEYAHVSLGETAAGTEVGVWFLPGGESEALFGTRDLVAVFDWLERTLGEYAFGNTVGSVAAWHPNSAGGIEHHPYWHIGRAAMSDSLVHAHEAAHGWFGNGVRMRCWEDFVLSEGTATYLAARGLGAAAGDEVESAIWAEYQQRLEQAVAQGDTIAWPQSCDAIDILEHPIFSSVPYLKGAFFLRAVESEVGRVALDPALARFYELHRGRAAGMQDLLDTLAAETGFDPTPLAAAWLRGLGIPPG